PRLRQAGRGGRLRAAGHPAVHLHADAAAGRGPLRGGEPVHPGCAVGRQPGRAQGHQPGAGAAAVLRMARARLHLALGHEGPPGVRAIRRRAAVRRARGPGRRLQGVPVWRGAQGRAQTVGMQGVLHRVHAGDADRHLHGLPRGRLRGLLQLRPDEPPPGGGSEHHMTDRAVPGEATWVDAALREHEEHTRQAGRPAVSGPEREERITMSHGAGGKATRTLVEAVFLDSFRNALLEPLEDAAQLHLNGSRVALTTDSYVVSPLFFPGGDIGDLAVNGNVNDLAVSGATPLYLSAGFILEEGFPVADLTRI